MFQKLYDLIKQALLKSIPPSTPHLLYLRVGPMDVERKTNVKPTGKRHRLTLWLLGHFRASCRGSEVCATARVCMDKRYERHLATASTVVGPDYMSKG